MKKILFVNQDTIPYVEETYLSKMGMTVPNKLQEAGSEPRIFMPKWGNINERRGQLHEVIRLSGLNITINDIDHPLIIKVASIPQTKLQVYFIDNEEFFSRKGQTVDADGNPYDDNGERAVFFARGVIETIKKQRWVPDVIVCNGWMAALLPLYAKQAYADEPAIADAKIVTAIYNQGPEKSLESTLKDNLYFKNITKESLEGYKDDIDGMELAKMAIDNSDGVIAAQADSNEAIMNYAKETGKKILEYPGEDFTAAYAKFLDTL
ncbi:MAG: glycogen/starch synthase [Prevotella sp.]|nr:glycogen/starch synthase [Prevotella sp.]MBR1839050.1 glycogen/starch synthase [Prevotella sp.]